jgi:AhpD family alkylhydroperoxidase
MVPPERKTIMEPRIDYRKYAQEPLKHLLGLEIYLAESTLGEKLIYLVKMRASQINGCAYCLDMHSIDARAAGETEQRLYALDAWAETPFFTDRERAALAWTEAVTLVSQTHAPDSVFEDLKKHFTEKEIVDLTLVVGMINLWNRLAIPLRSVPGHYKPVRAAAS